MKAEPHSESAVGGVPNQTTFSALTSDGVVNLAFAVPLTDLQNAFLRNVSDSDRSADDLRRLVGVWARVERLSVSLGEPIAQSRLYRSSEAVAKDLRREFPIWDSRGISNERRRDSNVSKVSGVSAR